MLGLFSDIQQLDLARRFRLLLSADPDPSMRAAIVIFLRCLLNYSRSSRRTRVYWKYFQHFCLLQVWRQTLRILKTEGLWWSRYAPFCWGSWFRFTRSGFTRNSLFLGSTLWMTVSFDATEGCKGCKDCINIWLMTQWLVQCQLLVSILPQCRRCKVNDL